MMGDVLFAATHPIKQINSVHNKEWSEEPCPPLLPHAPKSWHLALHYLATEPTAAIKYEGGITQPSAPACIHMKGKRAKSDNFT